MNDNNPKDPPRTPGRRVGGDDTPPHADVASPGVVGGDGVAVTLSDEHWKHVEEKRRRHAGAYDMNVTDTTPQASPEYIAARNTWDWIKDDAPVSRRQRQAEAREEYEMQCRSEFRGDDGGES